MAINLPVRIRKKLLEFQRGWANLPVNWVKEQNMHITLAFIGYIDDEQMLDVCRLTREIVRKYQPFEIKLERICLGPLNRLPRVIWTEGRKESILAQLKMDLEKALFDSNNSGYNQLEKRAFRPHITLARIRQSEWRSLPVKPAINKEIALTFRVESIDVMQSYLSQSGTNYVVLESAGL